MGAVCFDCTVSSLCADAMVQTVIRLGEGSSTTIVLKMIKEACYIYEASREPNGHSRPYDALHNDHTLAWS